MLPGLPVDQAALASQIASTHPVFLFGIGMWELQALLDVHAGEKGNTVIWRDPKLNVILRLLFDCEDFCASLLLSFLINRVYPATLRGDG